MQRSIAGTSVSTLASAAAAAGNSGAA